MKKLPANTAMLHVRIDGDLKAAATDVLLDYGLTPSDAVRIFLTRVVAEKGMPAGLTTDKAAYDAWFRDKVLEAMNDDRPRVPHEEAMARIRGNLKKGMDVA